jgi:hypothetical protein
MPPPYQIKVNITRADAREVIRRLIEDDDFRERFETDTRAVLAENGIDVESETLPEGVRLPAPEAIEDFLDLLDNRGLVPETASPFGFALMILAFGAMPVMIGDRSALDGTG